ncbi:cation diffusion facilitator family transporter [Anaerosphaera multitolerans]|uniref:Cation transporter n=1 Tax=Anaerosphaera multitolerans TaxID=2487351 RepID=A0A437S9E8_9FIRM|nr:cation diffusion facilitator family transporter [Anaerosphaera multitolerans]RVU55521.1 cation transporter [Anaerosphaera multitolerans]
MLVEKVLKLGNYGKRSTDRLEISIITAVFGIVANVFLAAVKILLFIFSGSVSILADAINNATDSISSIVTLVGAKLSSMPADKEHPYGHGRIEYISALVVSVFVLVAGIEFIRTSYNRIIYPVEVEFSIYSIVLMVLSIGVKLYMAHFYSEISEKINSRPIKAQSKDSLSDVFVTGVVVLSIVVNKMTGLLIDGYVGIVVSLFIIYSGYELISETLSALIGEAPEEGFLKKIEEIALSDDRIFGVHDIIVARFGPQNTYVSLHVQIAYNMTLVEAHSLVDNIEIEIEEKLNCIASIHIDPVGIYSDDERKIVGILNKVIRENKEIKSFHDLNCEDKIIKVEVVVNGNIVKTEEEEDEILKLIKKELKKEFDYEYNIIIDRYF